MKILIRTDGSKTLGNGHIVRMMALAKELALRNYDFTFALKQDDFWTAKLRENNFAVMRLPEASGVQELGDLIRKEKVSHVIYDTRGDLTRENCEALKNKTNIKFVAIDSPEDIRLAADTAIFPPIPQVKEWDWSGFQGMIFSGWEYVLLRSEFSKNIHPKPKTNKALISFGSTDPFHITEWLLDRLEETHTIFKETEFILVVGPQFDRIEALLKFPAFNSLNISIVQSPENIVQIFRTVDFAFIALGVTAYELASTSTPFLFVSISEDHEKSGGAFQSSSLGYSLGIVNKNLDNFTQKVSNFFNNYDHIKEQIELFQSKNTICNWDKIIEAIAN